MKPRTILLILLALVCGVSAAVGVNQLNRPTTAEADADTVSVVLVSQDIPRGGVLTPENCAVHQRPAVDLPEGYIAEIEAAIDRSVIVPMVKGEPVLEVRIASKEAGRGLAAMIEDGMRAFTIQTTHVAAGIGGMIEPNDKVDVLLTTRSNSKVDGSGGGATTTLLQNVQVLAVDRRLSTPEEGDSADLKHPKSVTLMVSPNQAAKLDLGMNMGMLHLSLRNPEDSSEAATRPATLAELRYHQEKPLSNMADKAGNLVGTMAKLWAGGDAPKTEATEKPGPVQYRTANIRTLRGSSRGHIRIDTAP